MEKQRKNGKFPGDTADRPNRLWVSDFTYVPSWHGLFNRCLAVFPWAHFRTTKAAVKMHTLLDLRGNIPSFIHVSDGKLHDVHALDLLLPQPGAIYVMDRGYVDFAPLHGLHQAGAFFITRAKSNMDAHLSLFGPDRSRDRHHLRSDHRPRRSRYKPALSRSLAAHPPARPGNGQDPDLPGRIALHIAPDSFCYPLRENPDQSSTCRERSPM
ncbi:MAG: transposase [Defluviicoccus sp.]